MFGVARGVLTGFTVYLPLFKLLGGRLCTLQAPGRRHFHAWQLRAPRHPGRSPFAARQMVMHCLRSAQSLRRLRLQISAGADVGQAPRCNYDGKVLAGA